MRAPLAPMGWPSATAPPFMFVRSAGKPEFSAHRHRLGGERLVDLEDIHPVHRPVEPLEKPPDRGHRGHHDPLGIEPRDRLTGDPREAREAVAPDRRVRGDHQRSGAVVHPGSVPRGHPAVLPEDRTEPRASDASVASGRMPSSRSTTTGPFRPGTSTGRTSAAKRPGLGGGVGAALALGGVGVHRLAGHAVAVRDPFRGLAHMDVLEGVGEPVVHHRIHQGAVPHLRSGPHPGNEVRGVRHGLHPTRDHHLRVPGEDRLAGEHHRLQPRPAHLVDGERAGPGGQSRAERRLAGGVLAESGGQHVAEG